MCLEGGGIQGLKYNNSNHNKHKCTALTLCWVCSKSLISISSQPRYQLGMSTNPMVKEKHRKNKKISTLKGWGRGSSDPERLSEDGHLSRAWKDGRSPGGNQGHSGQRRTQMKALESESHSVVSDSLRPHGLYSPWNSPGQNTGVGSLSFL